MAFDKTLIKDWVGIVKDIATIAGLIIGGLWARKQYSWFGEKHAKMELSFDIVPLGNTPDYQMVEVQADLANKGRRMQDLFDLHVELWGYSEKGTEKLRRITSNVQLPIRLGCTSYEDAWETVDGLTTLKYTYLAAIDHSIDWISVSITFYLSPKPRDLKYDPCDQSSQKARDNDNRSFVTLRKTKCLKRGVNSGDLSAI
jgi:hypothetical protein